MYSQVREISKLNSNDGSANALVVENDFDVSVGDISLSSLLELEFEPFSSLQEENGNPLLGLQNPESHDAQWVRISKKCHLHKVVLFVGIWILKLYYIYIFFIFRAAYEGPSQPKRLKITTDEITPGVEFAYEGPSQPKRSKIAADEIVPGVEWSTAENENPTSPQLPETEDAMVERPAPLSNSNVEESNEPLMAEVIVNEKKCKWFSKWHKNNFFDWIPIIYYCISGAQISIKLISLNLKKMKFVFIKGFKMAKNYPFLK